MVTRRERGIVMFGPKCPYCKGKNLYLKRTSPMEVYGCRDCEKKVKYMQEQGLSKQQMDKIIKGEV